MLMTLILIIRFGQQNFTCKDVDIKKFYRWHFDTVSKYNVGLKTLLIQALSLSEPEFFGNLVYKL